MTTSENTYIHYVIYIFIIDPDLCEDTDHIKEFSITSMQANNDLHVWTNLNFNLGGHVVLTGTILVTASLTHIYMCICTCM